MNMEGIPLNEECGPWVEIEEDESHCGVISNVNKDDIQYKEIHIADGEDHIPSVTFSFLQPKQPNKKMNMEGIPLNEECAPLVEMEEDESHCEVISVVTKDDKQYEVIHIDDDEDHIPSTNEIKASNPKEKDPKQPIMKGGRVSVMRSIMERLVNHQHGAEHEKEIRSKDVVQCHMTTGGQELILCEACDVSFFHPNRVQEHLIGRKHKKRMKNLNDNKEKTESLQMGERRCGMRIIMDALNRQSENHQSGAEHEKEIRSKDNLQCIVTTDGRELILCEGCNLIFNHPGKLQEHVIGFKHKKRMKNLSDYKKKTEIVQMSGRVCAIKDTVNRQLENHQHGAEHEKEIQSKDVLTCIVGTADCPEIIHCEVCNLSFHNPKSLQDHLNGKKHKNRLKNLNVNKEKTKSLQMGGRVSAMSAIKVTVNRQFENHQHGAQHEKEIRSKDVLQGTRIIYDRNFLMQMCNSPVARNPPKNLPNIPGITSPNHMKPKENDITINRVEEKQDPSKNICCEVCNIIFRNPRTLQEHLNGRKHKKRMKNLNDNKEETESLQMGKRVSAMSAIMATVNRQFENHHHGAEHEKEIRSKDVLQGTATTSGLGSCVAVDCTKFFHCEACNLKFSGALSLEEHLRGKKHKMKMMTLVANKEKTRLLQMGKRVNAMGAIMATVNRQFENHQHEAEHERKIRSKDILPRISTTSGLGSCVAVDYSRFIHCELCDLKFSGSVSLEEHLRGKEHRKMMKFEEKTRLFQMIRNRKGV